MVGIELRRACFRRRVTTLTLSVARWVRNSAIVSENAARCSVTVPTLLPYTPGTKVEFCARASLCSIVEVWADK